MNRLNVLLTGPGGRIGPHVVPAFRERYNLRLLDRNPLPDEPNSIVADLSDQSVLEKALEGIDVLVHLAATSDEAPFLEQLVPNNIVGLYNIFEAARIAGVKRIVYASTVQAIGSHKPGTITLADRPRPTSMYGATKVFGEALGSWYNDRYKMEFVAVRIGWFQPYDSPLLRTNKGARTIWLSPRDCAGILMAATEKKEVGYAIVFGTSSNEFERLSLAPAQELLDWEPEDSIAEVDKGTYGPPAAEN